MKRDTHRMICFLQISSLRSRLEKSDKELERTGVGRVEAERCEAYLHPFNYISYGRDSVLASFFSLKIYFLRSIKSSRAKVP